MHVVLTIWTISWILALASIAYWLFWYASTKILTTCGVLILFSRSALSKSFAFFSHYHKLKLDQSVHYCLSHYTSCQAHWNYVRYTQEKIAAQNNIGTNAVKNLAQDFFFYYLLYFNYSFSFFCYWEYQSTTHFDLEGSLEGSFYLIKISVYGTQKVIWWTTQSWAREPSSCKMLQNLPTIPSNHSQFNWFVCLVSTERLLH